MNQITVRVKKGTIGELLVTLRLLQYGVQAAAPLKDSGNDLIAVRGPRFCAIQVKSRTDTTFGLYDLPEYYHVVALVYLITNGDAFDLEQTRIFLLTRNQIEATDERNFHVANLGDYEISQQLIDDIFGNEPGEVEVDLVE